MKNQKQMIINKLKIDGFVNRNWALQNFCSRLGAIIHKLKREGWKFEARYIKTEKGLDYAYYTIKMPYKKVIYEIPELNREIVSYE